MDINLLCDDFCGYIYYGFDFWIKQEGIYMSDEKRCLISIDGADEELKNMLANSLVKEKGFNIFKFNDIENNAEIAKDINDVLKVESRIVIIDFLAFFCKTKTEFGLEIKPDICFIINDLKNEMHSSGLKMVILNTCKRSRIGLKGVVFGYV